LLTGGLVVLAVALVAGMFFLLSPRGSGVAAGFLRAQPGSIPWNGSSRFTVLIQSGATQGGPADQIAIASYDPAGGHFTLLALPANLWVTVPGYGQSELAEALQDGGPTTALRTVESLTHTVVPYYWTTDHATLAKWIDAFGGVTLTATEPIGLNSAGTPMIPAGRHHLEGSEAVQFATVHSAYDSSDGSDLLMRQQALLLGLIHHDFSPARIVKLPATIGGLGGDIATNVPYSTVPTLAQHLAALPHASVTTAYIGLATGTATVYRTNGRSVLLPDAQRIALLTDQLFSNAANASRAPIAVLNGSGVAGQATGLAGWLSAAHLHIAFVGSAKSFNFAHTRVYLPPNATMASKRAARQMATLLQVPVMTQAIPGAGNRVAVVIGQDYQDPTQH
jgi:LCP family protein required for cell wall assembly